MADNKIIWNLPSERTLDRIEELKKYLENFPSGMIADAARHELAQLEELAKYL